MLKKLLIVLALLLVAAVGVIIYLWMQVTALPEWYDPEAPEAVAQEGAPYGWKPVAGEGDGAVELRGFHKKTPLVKGKAAKAIRASRAVRKGERMEAGVVIDTSEVPRDDLSERDRDVLERALKLPGVEGRDVYVGVEDKPILKDGVPTLSPDAKLRVGNVTYSINDAAARLGMDASKLRAELNRKLQQINAER